MVRWERTKTTKQKGVEMDSKYLAIRKATKNGIYTLPTWLQRHLLRFYVKLLFFIIVFVLESGLISLWFRSLWFHSPCIDCRFLISHVFTLGLLCPIRAWKSSKWIFCEPIQIYLSFVKVVGRQPQTPDISWYIRIYPNIHIAFRKHEWLTAI